MFVSPIMSRAFWISALVFLTQFLILLLIFEDMTEDEDEGDGILVLFYKDRAEVPKNKFNAPVTENSLAVKMAQYIAMVIALISQDDAISTIGLVTVKYDPSITDVHGSATRLKWVVCNCLRFAEGIFTVFISFIFIVQSDQVLDMFMNFAAIEFVSELDNLFFEFASTGFIPGFKKEIAAVSEVSFERSRKDLEWIQRVSFFALLALLIAGVAVVDTNQNLYLEEDSCMDLQVNFGEQSLVLSNPLNLEGTKRDKDLFGLNATVPPSLIYSYFSGKYVRGNPDELVNDRYVYYERGLEHDPTAGKFYYCEEDEAWVFTIPAMAKNIPKASKQEGCEDGWLMQSPKTEAANLEDAPMDGWNVWTGVVQKTSIDVTCNECTRDSDCGMENGECILKHCECKENKAGEKEWEGPHCEVELPLCENLVWINFGESSSDFFYYKKGEYELRDRRAYNRPVYLLNLTGEHEVIFYSGTRWLDTYWDVARLEKILEDNKNGDDVNSDLHAYWHVNRTDNVEYFTDPIDSLHPTKISWMTVRSAGSTGTGSLYGASYPSNAKFECYNRTTVPEESYCGSHGKFNQTLGRCECTNLYGGFHCEYARGDPYAFQQGVSYLEWWEYVNSANASFYHPDDIWNTYADEFWGNYDDLLSLEDYEPIACGLAPIVSWEVIHCDYDPEL